MHESSHVVAMLFNGTFHTSNMQHYMKHYVVVNLRVLYSGTFHTKRISETHASLLVWKNVCVQGASTRTRRGTVPDTSRPDLLRQGRAVVDPVAACCYRQGRGGTRPYWLCASHGGTGPRSWDSWSRGWQPSSDFCPRLAAACFLFTASMNLGVQ